MEQGSRQALLRAIPAVHALLRQPSVEALIARFGRDLTVEALGRAQAAMRDRILAAAEDELPRLVPSAEGLVREAESWLASLTQRRLRPVINATGVIVHTNLGRSLLPAAAVRAVTEIASRYSTLEYDLSSGGRGSRHAHLEPLLTRLTGAEAAIAVNNNAAAVLLALAAIAAGQEVVVSRGELVEIGGSFRVPDVMAQSGVRLVEVGTTNKTRLEDYRRAIGPNTGALLKVHTSNYRIVGFSEDTPLEALVALGREHGLPVIYDVGSGALLDLAAHGIPGEPVVREAVAAGASLVTFSGDKLLGGPQAGIIVGVRECVQRCARHPLARAVRIDKLTAAALEATLLLYLDEARAVREIPTLRMLLAPLPELEQRAQVLARRLRDLLPADMTVDVVPVQSQPGGGSLPGVDLPSVAVTIDVSPRSAADFERGLRHGEPPVIARIVANRLVFDVRTLADDELEPLARAAQRVAESDSPLAGMLAGT